MISKIQLLQFEKGNIPEFLEMAIQSNQNELTFRSGIENKDNFTKQYTDLILELIQSSQRVNQVTGKNVKFNTFVRLQGKIISAAFHCDLTDYLKIVGPKLSFQQFTHLPNEQISHMDVSKGLMGNYIVIHKDFKRSHIFRNHLLAHERHLVMSGYTFCLGISINQASKKAWRSLPGAVLIKTINTKLNNIECDIDYGYLDLNVLIKSSL